jgi:outer membrane immunogenic protein
MKGAIAGGQLGWQIQNGMFVGGFEGDFQASWQSHSVTGTFNGVTLTVKEEVPWFGTIRARAGLAFDRSLVYLTAGAAYTNFKLSASGPLASSSGYGSRAGWTVGGGWEYMFWERWSAKIEYLYIDTGDVDLNLAGLLVSGSLRNQIVRGGINFHF